VKNKIANDRKTSRKKIMFLAFFGLSLLFFIMVLWDGG